MVPIFSKKIRLNLVFLKFYRIFFRKIRSRNSTVLKPYFPRKNREKIWTTELVFLARSSGSSFRCESHLFSLPFVLPPFLNDAQEQDSDRGLSSLLVRFKQKQHDEGIICINFHTLYSISVPFHYCERIFVFTVCKRRPCAHLST